MSTTTILLPGQPLGEPKTPGSGTHLFNDHLIASVAGTPSHSSIPRPSHSTLPTVNDLVLARITRITQKQALASILSVGGADGGLATCADGFAALIRVQDVRATEKDRVRVAESFRPGDVVRAVVVSIGDERAYYLSTARNDLGVLVARSEDGNTMYPLDWKEFRDPVTGKREGRKVAKPC